MRSIKYPAIYKHFKNNYYAVMSVSKRIKDKVSDDNKILLQGYHTELNKLINTV